MFGRFFPDDFEFPVGWPLSAFLVCLGVSLKSEGVNIREHLKQKERTNHGLSYLREALTSGRPHREPFRLLPPFQTCQECAAVANIRAV